MTTLNNCTNALIFVPTSISMPSWLYGLHNINSPQFMCPTDLKNSAQQFVHYTTLEMCSRQSVPCTTLLKNSAQQVQHRLYGFNKSKFLGKRAHLLGIDAHLRPKLLLGIFSHLRKMQLPLSLKNNPTKMLTRGNDFLQLVLHTTLGFAL